MSHPELSPRQLEVLKQVQLGKNNVEIGLALGISTATVKVYICQMIKLYSCNNRNALIVKTRFAGRDVSGGHAVEQGPVGEKRLDDPPIASVTLDGDVNPTPLVDQSVEAQVRFNKHVKGLENGEWRGQEVGGQPVTMTFGILRGHDLIQFVVAVGRENGQLRVQNVPYVFKGRGEGAEVDEGLLGKLVGVRVKDLGFWLDELLQ